MKTIGRILVILLAIAVVAGATYALGQTSWFAEQFGSRAGDRDRIQLQDGDGFGEGAPGFDRGGRPNRTGFDGRGRDEADGFNVFAGAEFVRILLPMAVVITAVVLLTKLANGWRKRRKTAVAAPGDPLNQA
jgi:hypothetical protein